MRRSIRNHICDTPVSAEITAIESPAIWPRQIAWFVSHDNLDFLLNLGHLFTLVVYGQLICEQAELTGLHEAVLDQIFATLVRDFSAYAVALHGKSSSTQAQQDWAVANVGKPVVDADRFGQVWEQVVALADAYEMRP